ncbi:MAG: MtrB/PioB family outer membrane beta-barrel protein [Nitrospirae bacterium]|nr:MtrB/PioB family outer membrane beta-barrel protein [Nitrospirota bacterium]
MSREKTLIRTIAFGTAIRGVIPVLLIVGLVLSPSASAKEPLGLADEAVSPRLQDLNPAPAEKADVPAQPEEAVPLSVESLPIPSAAEEPPLPAAEGTGPAPTATGEPLPPSEGTPSLEGEVSPLEPPPPVPAEVHLSLTPKWRWIDLSPESYKAREFRILPEGPYLDRLDLSLSREDDTLNLSLHHLLLMEEFRNGRIMEDSHGRLSWERYGLTLATPRDRQGLHFRITPSNTLALQLDLNLEERQGSRPLPTENVTALTAGGKIDTTAVVELAEPIHDTTTTLSLSAEYLNGPLVLQLENRFQIFDNHQATEMTWDNPFRDLSGRAKLPEDHWVQTLTVQPSYRFSDRWMLMNSLSYLQVSSRINLVSFSTDPDLGSPIPYPAIEPDVRSLFFHSALTGEISDNLSLKFRYRMNSYKNDTLILTPHPAYVILEEVVGTARTPTYLSYRKNIVEMEALYRPVRWGTLKGGIRQTVRSRDQREVTQGTERRYYLDLRGTWSEKLTGEAGYALLQVDQDPYNAGWLKTTYDPLATETPHPLLRALDLAQSTSEEFHGGVTYYPFEVLSVGLRYTAENRTYPDTLVGRQSSEDRRTILDLQYSPADRFLAYGQATLRQSDFQGRYTWAFDPALSSPSQDPTYIAFRQPRTETVSDKTDDYLVGMEYTPTPLTRLTGQYLISWNRTADLLLPSTEYRYEEFSLEASRRIPRIGAEFPKDITLAVEYRYEHSTRTDYALDNIPGPGDPPNPDSPDDLYLGIEDPGYTAHVISLSCTFAF